MSSAWHSKGTIVLSCHHKTEIALPLPARGETQYCRLCGQYRVVEDTAAAFTVKCVTGRCTLSRYIGADKEKALETARRHVQKMARHRVVIKDGLVTVAEVTNTEETLFVTGSERSVVSADTQATLKNFGSGSVAA